uniref:Uncharacterized protein n=1 Tax=Arundo donax TaxID=35708 RepID=A0A0A8Z2G6_ARUDO
MLQYLCRPNCLDPVSKNVVKPIPTNLVAH